MMWLNIALFSLFICLILNAFVLKIISILDYEVLGLHNRVNSIMKVYKNVFENRNLLIRFSIASVTFLIFNYIILFRIFDNFNFILVHIYLKYYYLFLILYIFAFIDYITYYIYSILSYPLIIISLLIFILSFLGKNSLGNNLETIILVGFFYLMIKKFKLLGDGDFDIILIISLTLGVLPTIFIFYISVIISGLVSLWILLKNSFRLKYNKMPFVPFIFISTFLFIILKL